MLGERSVGACDVYLSVQDPIQSEYESVDTCKCRRNDRG